MELYADLMLQGESVQYQRTVRVYPPVMTDFNDHLKAEIQFLNLDQQGDSYYLPDQIDGKQISWQKPLPTQGITLLFLSIFMAAALYFADRQEKLVSCKPKQKYKNYNPPSLYEGFGEKNFSTAFS